MAGFVTVGSTDDVPAGEIRAFEVEGNPVSVVNVDGSFYAFDDLCTHRQCSLADGDLEGTTLECICHGSQFDVRTGEVLNGPATEPVATHEVRVEDGSIQVQG
jgi:3-phenylpropionate/trans-cinnamate dioxygenase ferredoxin component